MGADKPKFLTNRDVDPKYRTNIAVFADNTDTTNILIRFIESLSPFLRAYSPMLVPLDVKIHENIIYYSDFATRKRIRAGILSADSTARINEVHDFGALKTMLNLLIQDSQHGKEDEPDSRPQVLIHTEVREAMVEIWREINTTGRDFHFVDPDSAMRDPALAQKVYVILLIEPDSTKVTGQQNFWKRRCPFATIKVFSSPEYLLSYIKGVDDQELVHGRKYS